MSASRDDYSSRNVDINPDSNLAIHLYLQNDARLPQKTPRETDDKVDRPRTEMNPDQGQRGNQSNMSNSLRFDKVLQMSPEELDHLQDRVGQMEVSTYGLLTRIYGHFASNRRPFSLVVTNRLSDPKFPETGSPQHRQLLFSQYKNIMSIAEEPTRYVDMVKPLNARGVKALQDYQMQLMLLAEHRGAQMKRKCEEEDTSPRRKVLPKVDSAYLKGMRAGCRVLDFSSRSDISYRDDDNRRVPFPKASATLTDYQLQLRLLEEQNQKRMLIAKQEKEQRRDNNAKIQELDREIGEQSTVSRQDQSSVPIRIRQQDVA